MHILPFPFSELSLQPILIVFAFGLIRIVLAEKAEKHMAKA